MKKKRTGHPVVAGIVLVLMIVLLARVVRFYGEKWRYDGKADGAVVTLPACEAHSQEELEAAANAVIDGFSDFRGHTLERLWYEPQAAAPLEQAWSEKGGIEPADVVILFADMTYSQPGAEPEIVTQKQRVQLMLFRTENGWRWDGTDEPERPEIPGQTVTPTPEPMQSPAEAAGLRFDTGRITVYEIGGDLDEITDYAAILALEDAVRFDQWEALTEPEDQVMAEPNYALDLGNGCCFGLLGDGYIIWGTGFAYLDDAETSFEIADGVQYQVNREFTDQLKALCAE